MATIVFFEKPGCINNTRQKQLLVEAGHDVECHNLLNVQWEAHELRRYFNELPVEKWFNPSAPAMKNGDVLPSGVNEEQALALMMDDPLLIRRPLLRIGDQRRAGFDAITIDNWIGLALSRQIDSAALETCPRKEGHRCETI
ncbi:MAG: ArsC/Spx/MgsR family protein [Gammaproteobacteria bacterium]|jgi:nitrogenase-associated protein